MDTSILDSLKVNLETSDLINSLEKGVFDL